MCGEQRFDVVGPHVEVARDDAGRRPADQRLDHRRELLARAATAMVEMRARDANGSRPRASTRREQRDATLRALVARQLDGLDIR